MSSTLGNNNTLKCVKVQGNIHLLKPFVSKAQYHVMYSVCFNSVLRWLSKHIFNNLTQKFDRLTGFYCHNINMIEFIGYSCNDGLGLSYRFRQINMQLNEAFEKVANTMFV